MTDDKPLIPILIDPDQSKTPTTVPETKNSGFRWSIRSKKAMEGIHPDLRKVCDLALQLSSQDFVIAQGKRTIEQQKQYVAQGKSQTMHSRHLGGFAIDYVDYPAFSYNEAKCKLIADAFKSASAQLNIPIVWGGDWEHFKDDDHIELSKEKYPD